MAQQLREGGGGGVPSMFLHMWDLWTQSENTKDPFQHVKPALEFRPHHAALQRNVHVSQGSKGLHVKDLLCAQICAPGPCSSDVPHSGTLLYFGAHIVIESYGCNQACSVYAWSQHQQELGITTAVFHMRLLCGSLDVTEIGLRYTEFTVGSPVQQEPKQWWRQGEAEGDVLHGCCCCAGVCSDCSCCLQTSVGVRKKTENKLWSHSVSEQATLIHDKNKDNKQANS